MYAVNGNWSSAGMGDESQAPGSTGKCRDINNVLLGLSDKGYATEIAVGSRGWNWPHWHRRGGDRQGSPLQQRKQNPEKDLTWVL